jgi:hypothetical protein
MVPKKERSKYQRDINKKFKKSIESESILGDSNAISNSGMQDKSSVSDSVSLVAGLA